MKRIMLTLMCTCMALGVMAATPRLTRSQLKQAPMVKEHPVKPKSVSGQDKPLSLQQVLKERNLTLDDNRLNSQVSSGQSRSSRILPGVRIASIDAYDFDWDDENAVAIVNDTTFAVMGKGCSLEMDSLAGLEFQWYLAGFYGSYAIPVSVDAGIMTIPAGVQLDCISSSVNDTVTTWRLYAMPLSWLTGNNDDYEDIHGMVYDDGSIEFTEGFGFLVEKMVRYTGTDEIVNVEWGLSPIMTNLILYQPNARQYCVADPLLPSGNHEAWVIDNPFDDYDADPTSLRPRPINPRPNGSGSSGSSTKDTGSTKPITPPRQFNPTIGGALRNQDNTSAKAGRELSTQGKNQTSSAESPGISLYIYQLDDTTLMVYNLFGKDYCWNYMNIYPDSTIYIPAQPMGCTRDGNVLYNCSGYHADTDTLMWGNVGTYTQHVIQWGNTYLCSANDTEGHYTIKSGYMCSIINLDADIVDGLVLSAPEDLTVNPTATTAEVAWADTVNTSWNLRYRPWVDTSGNPLDCDLNGDYYDALSDIEENDWIFVDNDGDGDEWQIGQVADGDYCFVSESWNSVSGDLDPDNWLISPVVHLKGVLKFTVWGLGSFFSDCLMPCIRVGQPLIEPALNDFVPLAEIYTTAEKTEYTFDLSDYDGQIGRIAFRHCNSYGKYAVYLDNIFIGDPEAAVEEPNPWIYVTSLDSTAYTIEELCPESIYEVQVQAADECGQNSAWTGIDFYTMAVDIPLGDVNDDQTVNISDVTCLINRLLSKDWENVPGQFSYDNADCNQDGKISISDVTTLINYLLSQSW